MSYRDDVDAARARSEALARELAELEARLGDRDALEARAATVRTDLAAARARVDQARARGTLPLVDRVVVKTPCKESWAGMSGDERKRFCGRCQKHVYDLSAMTADEADAMLRGATGEMCIRLFRRPDGTVLTSDCPDGARRRTRGRLAVAGVAIAAAAGIAGTAARMHESPKPSPHKVEIDRTAVMGQMELSVDERRLVEMLDAERASRDGNVEMVGEVSVPPPVAGSKPRR